MPAPAADLLLLAPAPVAGTRSVLVRVGLRVSARHRPRCRCDDGVATPRCAGRRAARARRVGPADTSSAAVRHATAPRARGRSSVAIAAWRIAFDGCSSRHEGDEPFTLRRWRPKRVSGALSRHPRSPPTAAILVVNQLHLEDYLRGVVPVEIGERSPGEQAAVRGAGGGGPLVRGDAIVLPARGGRAELRLRGRASGGGPGLWRARRGAAARRRGRRRDGGAGALAHRHGW